MVELILTYIDPKCIDIDCSSRRLYFPNDTLSKRNGTPQHLTIAQCPCCDATNNGDRPSLLRKLISAPELTKHLTISMCPWLDPINNGDSLEHCL
jgi:hypothetical protein